MMQVEQVIGSVGGGRGALEQFDVILKNINCT